MNQPSSSTFARKGINFLDDDIPISEIMGKFQNHIYKFIKHAQVRSKWKAYEFKNSLEVFEPGTILSVIDFDDNYTFVPQGEIQSEW